MSGVRTVLQPSSNEDDFFNFGTSMEAFSKQHLKYPNDNIMDAGEISTGKTKVPSVEYTCVHP